MRCTLWLLILVCGGSLTAQDRRDPTIPRSALQPTATMAVNDELPAIPELRLKAIVMQDRDHASAVLTSGERRVWVKLVRNTPTRFTMKGVQFEVLDFDGKSIRVKCHAGEQLVN